MVERPEVVRDVKYFHSPTAQEWGNPERFHYLTDTIVRQFFLNPSLSFSRYCWGDLLYKLYWGDPEAYASGYDENDVLLTIAFLQDYLTTFGLALHTEVEAVNTGQRLPRIDPSEKIVSYKDLLDMSGSWKEDGLIVSMAHGSLDPPHFGHSRMALQAYKYSDIVIGAFDPNGLVRHMKGEDRPRFPQLYWRMWELAGGVPTVDYVIVTPVGPSDWQSPDRLDARFVEIYQELGIKAVLAGKDHPLIDKYRERMAGLGGFVIYGDMESKRWSSTQMMDHLTNNQIAKRSLLNYDKIYQQASRMRNKIESSINPSAWKDIELAMAS